MHPDWQLCLDAVYASVVQPRFPVIALDYDMEDTLSFAKLVSQLAPNIAAQLTAAAIFCRLHARHVRGAGLQLFHKATAAGDFDGIMAVLCVLMVRLLRLVMSAVRYQC